MSWSIILGSLASEERNFDLSFMQFIIKYDPKRDQPRQIII
jgi:hypothetical protein